MKNVVEFTAFAIETWAAALSVFEPKIVNRVIVEIGLAADPFPDLGKLVMRCEEHRRKAANLMPSDGKVKLAESTIKAAADALQLEI